MTRAKHVAKPGDQPKINRKLGARMRGGRLETAVRTYQHTRTGHVVTLVGTIHVGEQDYFDRLRARIDELDRAGWLVQYELVASEVRTDITDDEQERIEKIKTMSLAAKWLADLLALPMQHRWFPLPAHWQHADVSMLDMVRACPDLSHLDKITEAIEKAQQNPGTAKVVRWVMNKAVRNLPRVMALGDWMRERGLSETSTAEEAYEDFIVDHRNRVAVDHILAVRDRPVVSIWGAGHLPGMDTLLRRAGYDRVGVDWERAL